MPRVKHGKRKAPTAKTHQFDARFSEDQKSLTQRAADLEGRSMTDFVINSAQECAVRSIQEQEVLVLTARESEAFVGAILNPPEPGPVMRRAAQEYLVRMGLK